jgi:Flp pilus assembly protein TadD
LAHNNLGNLLARAGRMDEAMACYQKVLEMNPDDITVICNLAGW